MSAEAHDNTSDVNEVHHLLTILAVDDLKRSTTFYEEAFGWPRKVDVPVYVEFELPDGRGLGLYDREAFKSNTGVDSSRVPADLTTSTELYFRVRDLQAAVDRLQAAGGRLLSAPARRDWGDAAAYFKDPNGNVLVVAVPVPPEDGA